MVPIYLAIPMAELHNYLSFNFSFNALLSRYSDVLALQDSYEIPVTQSHVNISYPAATDPAGQVIIYFS